jgi:hypothetical protein
MGLASPPQFHRGAAPTLALALLVLGLLGLAACQPLPQPFQHAETGINPLTELKAGVGVALRPIAGLDLLLSDEITSEVVHAFDAADIPASAVAENRASFRLRASGTVQEMPGGQRALELDWQLADAAGTVLDAPKQETTIPPGIDRKESLARLAQSLVAQLLPKLAEPMPKSALPDAVRVYGVSGAPGDGGSSLKRAIEYVLTKYGVPLAQPNEDNVLVVTADVAMGKPDSGQQTISIRWTLHAPDGTELGTVTQANKVKAGSLDRLWGETALLIADAAYDGIGALLQKVWTAPLTLPPPGNS